MRTLVLPNDPILRAIHTAERVIVSDVEQLSANTLRSTNSTTEILLKSFLLRYPGNVRLRFEYRSVLGLSAIVDTRSNHTNLQNFSTHLTTFQIVVRDFTALPIGSIITLHGRVGDITDTMEIRNVSIRYSFDNNIISSPRVIVN